MKVIWIMLTTAVFILPAHEAYAADPRHDLAQIVRLMGYGGGIHNFKNYVLRGRMEYQVSARKEFTQILEIIARLKPNTELNSTQDQQALRAIKAVVESYNAALDRVTELRDKEWRIEDIDRAVIIDDTAAKIGLNHLRNKWTWSDFEEIEFQLGYGNAIHNFKNYVLRGHESYHTEALKNLLAVDSLLAGGLSRAELINPQTVAESLVTRKGEISPDTGEAYDDAVKEMTHLFREVRVALENVERVARAYRENLVLIERLIAMQRSVRQIDLAVKINDGPAMAGLAHLRGQRAGITAQLLKP